MFEKLLTTAALVTLAFGSVHATTVISGGGVAQAGTTQTVTLSDIETALVPMRKTQGDREFGGNGPEITCRTTLRVSSDRRAIEAVTYFKARETKSDWSTVEETFTNVVYRAPSGKTIDRILDPTTSEVRFTSKAGGFQFLAPGEDIVAFLRAAKQLAEQVLNAERTLSNRSSDTREVRRARDVMDKVSDGLSDIQFGQNHVHSEHPASGPVVLFNIIGDTGGDDISDDRNGKDDTRIQSISFRPVRVQFR